MTQSLSVFRQNKFFDLYLFCFYVVVTFALYFQSINNFFVLDDFIFLKAASLGSMSANFHFFPVPLLIYRIVYVIFGLNPVPLRIVIFLLNSLNCLFVYKASYKLFEHHDKESDDQTKFWKSFLCSLLFAVHYIHVETIIYFSELHEMLYSLFYLLGIYSYLNYCESNKNKHLYLVFIFYLLCILSKETAVSFIFCIFLSEMFLFKSKVAFFFKKFHYLLSITAVFILIRFFAFPKLDKLDYSFNIFTVILEIFKNVVFAFTAFIVSLDFNLIKDIYKASDTNLILSFKDVLHTYPAAIVLLLIVPAIYLIILKKSDKIIFTSFVFIIITISSFIWLAGYERYLYLPSVGFCILLFQYLGKISLEKRYLKISFMIILIFYTFYNIYNLKQKESNWKQASQISFKTVSQIVNLTKDLPPGSVVYFNDIPGDYKGAWILRDGIHEIPELFVKRNDIKFYYFYEMATENKPDKYVYIYEYSQNLLIQQ